MAPSTFGVGQFFVMEAGLGLDLYPVDALIIDAYPPQGDKQKHLPEFPNVPCGAQSPQPGKHHLNLVFPSLEVLSLALA